VPGKVAADCCTWFMAQVFGLVWRLSRSDSRQTGSVVYRPETLPSRFSGAAGIKLNVLKVKPPWRLRAVLTKLKIHSRCARYSLIPVNE
jgi:hypothetical protein